MAAHDPSAWSAARRLAEHALSADAATLPDAVLAAVRAFTMDTIGVGVGGAGSPYAAALARTAAGWGAGDAASVWGFDLRLPTPHTAFLNAFLAHCQEFDCVHEGAVLHPFTVVAPVLLAEAEARGMNDRVYLAACAAGVDVAATLGLAAVSQIQFFRPATCGLFGAVAALCRARGLSVDATVDAFGYALAFASGTMQAHVEGTPALAVQVGNAARSAFWAVDIAEAGLPGPVGSIDGPFGYLSLFERETALAPLLDRLGSPWRAEEVSWKPYPTGRAAHGGIDMALALRAQGVVPEAVSSLVVQAPPLILHLVGRPIVAPLEVNYARLCLPYAMAVALRKGAVTLEDFTPEVLGDAQTHALAARIKVEGLPISDQAAFIPQRARATLSDGSVRDVALEALPGSPVRPLSAQAQRAKLAANLRFGLRGDDAARLEAIAAGCAALGSGGDVAQLNRLASLSEGP